MNPAEDPAIVRRIELRCLTELDYGFLDCFYVGLGEGAARIGIDEFTRASQ